MSQEGGSDGSTSGGSEDSTNPRVDQTHPKTRRPDTTESGSADSSSAGQPDAPGEQGTFADRASDDADASDADSIVEDIEAEVQGEESTTGGATGSSKPAGSDPGDDSNGVTATSSPDSSAGPADAQAAGSDDGSTDSDQQDTTSPQGQVSEYLEANGIRAGEFGRQTLTTGALAEWAQSPGNEQACPEFPAEITSEEYGGWEEFDPSTVQTSDWTTLGQGALGRSGDGGFRGDQMDSADIPGQPTEADTVYRTRYIRIPDSLKRQEFAGYGFCSALGVTGPRMRYNESEHESYTESADRDLDGKDVVDLMSPESAWADRVDRDELLDVAAVHLITGNWDIKSDNVMILEDGSVRIFDYDRVADKEWLDRDHMRDAGVKKRLRSTIDKILGSARLSWGVL